MIAREIMMVSGAAHLLQRTGLAMAGAMGRTFVAAQLAKGHVAFFGTLVFIATTIVIGAVGFYIGINRRPRRAPAAGTENRGDVGRTDPGLAAATATVASPEPVVPIYRI
ncbi:hypothetical protein [Bradyrhizobium sp. USDA 4454]